MDRINDGLSGFLTNDSCGEFNAEFDRGGSSLGGDDAVWLDDSVLTGNGDFRSN